MMVAKEWRRRRSNFNHAWLKNRLIVALSRACKVLDGKIEDDAIWGDLSALLSEWPSRQNEAKQVLDAYPQAMSPKATVTESALSNLEPQLANWLADLAHQRWAEAEKPEDNLSRALEAITDVDLKIQSLSKALTSTGRKKSSIKLSLAIKELQAAASVLGESFSTLGSKAI